jgi:hypothetical protein
MNKIKAWWSGIKNKKTVVALAVAVVLILVIALVWWLFWGEYNSPHAAFAPSGKLVSGFPKEFVLDSAAIVGKSYTIGYAYNLNQYTANWTSSSSIDDLYNQYVNYFVSNGWTITNSSTNMATFRGVYAVTSTADANVVITSGKDGLKVTVSYVKK